MLLTNNYYHITNKVYKFISEENFLKNLPRYIKINIEMYRTDTKFQNLYFFFLKMHV